ncbi:hypothetical protein ACF087_16610 [Streptomyces goshikiensis]|uniref:hypothetical protein n=1 Tax=Streptomyces goshikiensis TaxID=1942 RepID=UPI0036FD6694
MARPLYELHDVPVEAGDGFGPGAAALPLLPERLLTLSLKLPGEWTESGAWLTPDLRERPQPEVAAENAPRLATALKRIFELTGSEIDPGDPTRHARPTAESGSWASSGRPSVMRQPGTSPATRRVTRPSRPVCRGC